VITRTKDTYLNGWCQRGTHHYCPDAPNGGLIGRSARAALLFYRLSCSCSCHRADGQMSLEEAK